MSNEENEIIRREIIKAAVKEERSARANLIDCVLGGFLWVPLLLLVELAFVKWIWATFMSGMFGLVELPNKPLFGAILIVGYLKMRLSAKSDAKEDWKITKMAIYGLFTYGLIFLHALIISKFL